MIFIVLYILGNFLYILCSFNFSFDLYVLHSFDTPKSWILQEHTPYLITACHMYMNIITIGLTIHVAMTNQ